jgi:hypothetical protein
LLDKLGLDRVAQRVPTPAEYLAQRGDGDRPSSAADGDGLTVTTDSDRPGTTVDRPTETTRRKRSTEAFAGDRPTRPQARWLSRKQCRYDSPFCMRHQT